MGLVRVSGMLIIPDRNGHKETFWAHGNKFSILIGMCVTWVYALIKIKWTILLRSVHFMMHKLYSHFWNYEQNRLSHISPSSYHLFLWTPLDENWKNFLFFLSSVLPLPLSCEHSPVMFPPSLHWNFAKSPITSNFKIQEPVLTPPCTWSISCA